MKISPLSILLTTTFLSTPVFAQTTVNSYEKLLNELSNSATADVVLDMNGTGIDLNGATGTTIADGQSVTFKNIDSWENTSQNVINKGTAAFNNVVFENNDAILGEGPAGGGGIIKNDGGHITEINNVKFDNNKSDSNKTLWGGVIDNLRGGVIDVIKNASFSDNYAYAGDELTGGAPHGGVIYNGNSYGGTVGGTIKLIDNVVFENNSMTSKENNTGGAHGVAIDNNEYGVIEKITNSKFINNKTYRTGTEEKDPSLNYHASGGAMDNYNYIGEISNTLFQGNSAETESVSASAGSGAIMSLYSGGETSGMQGRIEKIVNVKFINNYAKNLNGMAYGGAVSTGGQDENGSAYIGRMENVLFQGNYAQGGRDESGYIGAYGGALTNSGYIGSISGKFVNNHAENTKGVSSAYGGAIDNVLERTEISLIQADFEGNYVKAVDGSAYAGAISNRNQAKISEIHGDFTKNYILSKTKVVNGGAIFNQSTIGDIKGNFSQNYSISDTGEATSGAIMQLGNTTSSATISSISGNFTENYAKSGARATGGAINNNSYAIISEGIKGNFSYNYAISNSSNNVARGGAIMNFGYIKNIIGDFNNNYAQTSGTSAIGGAISNQYGNTGSLGIDELKGIYNNNHVSALGEKGYAQGGAIYNKSGNQQARLGINSSTFINNYAEGTLDTTNGGAIWNDGTIGFNGNNYFEGNYVISNGTKFANDIYNAGTINMSANSMLDIKGGITGKNGSINLGENSRLNVYTSQISGNNLFMSDNSTLAIEINNIQTDSTEQSGGKIDGDITLNGTNNLYVEAYIDNTALNKNGEYQFANNVDSSNGEWNLQYKDNGLYKYNMQMTEDLNKNKLTLTYERKSAEEISDSLGITEEEAEEIIQIIDRESDNEIFEEIRNEIDHNAQEKNANISNTLNDMRDTPSTNFDIIKNIDDILVKIVNNQIISRQNKKSANNVWLNGLYHTSENDGDLDYEADSFGFVGGADRQLSENVIGGLGYSYIKTDGKSSNKDLDIDTHSLFVYGEYSKNNWFVNLYASYNQSEINQDKQVLDYQLKGKYDVDMYSSQILGGRNIYFDNNKLYLRPNIGLRYYHIVQDSYRDNAGIKYEEVSGDILTGIIGTDLAYNCDIKDYSVSHRGYINATYDLINDDVNMYMALPNGNGYYVNQDADNELGFEIGYGLEAQLNDNIKIGLNYEFDWQKDYNAHLTFINMHYNF